MNHPGPRFSHQVQIQIANRLLADSAHALFRCRPQHHARLMATCPLPAWFWLGRFSAAHSAALAVPLAVPAPVPGDESEPQNLFKVCLWVRKARPRAACGVANPRWATRPICGLRLAAHPDPHFRPSRPDSEQVLRVGRGGVMGRYVKKQEQIQGGENAVLRSFH